jgi:hypothetical protein
MHWECRACGGELPARERVGRRDVCPTCGADLHACRQCVFYEPGIYNECREPQAERVLDKTRANFCDFYAPGRAAAGAGRPPGEGTGGARAELEALFRKK